MSVAFGAALSGGKKRLFEERVPEEGAGLGRCFKRARHLAGPPGSCYAHRGPSSSRQELVARLLEMFPGVDEKTIVAVLENYGENLDAAIESLNQLKLVQGDQVGEVAQQSQAAESSNDAHSPAQRLSAAWLDHFLREFYSSRQPQEAQLRVARLLEEFEAAVINHYKTNSEEMVAVKNEYDKMKKANVILSKAVAVQHNRLQEAAHKEQEAAHREKELQSMKELLTNYQEKLRALELNNYTLTMHLQRATGPPPGHGDGRPPDVY